MDACVGKLLLIAAILQCLDPILTIAAALVSVDCLRSCVYLVLVSSRLAFALLIVLVLECPRVRYVFTHWTAYLRNAAIFQVRRRQGRVSSDLASRDLPLRTTFKTFASLSPPAF